MKATKALVVVKDDLAQQWATRINRHLGASVESIIAAGRDLIAAKKPLQHGGWERMFAGHPEAVKEPLRFSRQTAFRLMAIAEHRVLGNVAHVQHLPPSWGTLYELTKQPDDVLEAALADGRIQPGLERRHVKGLGLGLHAPAEQDDVPSPFDLAEAKHQIHTVVYRQIDRCPRVDWPHVIGYLRSLANQLERTP